MSFDLIEQNWKPKANPWLLAIVALAAFIALLDSSTANVALSHICGGLGACRDQGTWVLTATAFVPECR